MKILQINTVCKSGSTGKIAYDLHSWLKQEGHESKIAYGRGNITDDRNTWRFATKWEVYAHALLTRVTGLTGCFSPFATRKLIQHIDTYVPDVVHLHNIHGYYVDVYKLIKHLKKKGIRTIITLHDEWLYTGKCGYAYDCNKWMGECGDCPQLKEYPASLFFDRSRLMYRMKRRLFRKFDNLTIVTPSQWLANRVKQSIFSHLPVVVVPNGIETKVFYPRDVSALRAKYNVKNVVLHVTSDFGDKRKGGHYVLELAQRMPNVSFFIVGNLKPIVNATPNVYAMGRTENQDQLAEWYSFAAVSIIASTRETFSMVCAESLACGTPVVGFEAGGPSEVAPEKYGLFVPYADISALERSVYFALDGNMHRNIDCTKFSKAKYDKDVVAKQYIALYCLKY